MRKDVSFRKALPEDIDTLSAFIFEHGVNSWNYLPKDSVLAHLASIASNDVEGIVAERNGEILGFTTFEASSFFAAYQPPERKSLRHGYICEVVVHRAFVGQGIGTRLLQEAVNNLRRKGFSDIYADRHEENMASAGMMKKAGFVEIDTFSDLKRRESGSRRTTVCRYAK
jgi:L-amino acid N-acyltransferase YncA